MEWGRRSRADLSFFRGDAQIYQRDYESRSNALTKALKSGFKWFMVASIGWGDVRNPNASGPRMLGAETVMHDRSFAVFMPISPPTSGFNIFYEIPFLIA